MDSATDLAVETDEAASAASTRADLSRLKWFILACVVLIVTWLSVSTVSAAIQPAPPAEAQATPDEPGLIIEIV